MAGNQIDKAWVNSNIAGPGLSKPTGSDPISVQGSTGILVVPAGVIVDQSAAFVPTWQGVHTFAQLPSVPLLPINPNDAV